MLSQFKTRNVIFGPPGTGKTTFLLSILEQAVKEEIPLCEIGYMSFTRSAVGEAKARAKGILSQAKEKDFTYFTTLHSLCFRLLNLNKEQVISFGGNNKWANQFCKEMGYNINSYLNSVDETTIISKDDRMCLAEQKARNLCISIEDFYMDYDDREFTLHELVLYREALIKFKKTHGLYDFADMLENVANTDIFIPHLQQLFIDETQDLADLQWKVVWKLINNADQVYIAGDDDQAIYTFAGASPVPLVSLGNDKAWNKIVLGKSYRVPKLIQKVAFNTLNRIPEEERIVKEWSPREESGNVHSIRSILELRDKIREGKWGILGRTNYIVRHFTKDLYKMGVRFTYGNDHDSVNKKQFEAIMTYESLRQGRQIHRNKLVILNDYITNFRTYLDTIPYDFVQLTHFPTRVYHTLEETPWYDAFSESKIPQYQRQYYRELLANNESLTGEPRIECLTMHASKGKEWDNVIIIYDISEATMRSLVKTPGDEYRVLYVGETRAKQNLYRVIPSTQTHYPFVY
ncbi:MAG: ATP-dependent helicase [Lachnospiraceae bacterium]|nr:ATP-dependent helicase [Clostridia bacterium]MBR4982207.1 ATP-dependent helicase [Lachnospiraceae bacterium]